MTSPPRRVGASQVAGAHAAVPPPPPAPGSRRRPIAGPLASHDGGPDASQVGVAVRARGLRKSFGPTLAVDDLDLVVPAGSFTGVVGPNGAGKSTTMRMLTGLLRPDAGSAVVDGIDVWADPVAAKRRIGVLPEDPPLFDRLTGRQLLTHAGLLRELPREEVQRRTDALLGVLGLGDAAGVVVADYSTGMRKKIALGQALLHAPRVLFLDEPFESVDPVSTRTLRAVLDRHRAAGGSVVLSSHVMPLVESLCDHVAIVHAGRVVAAGPVREVAGQGGLEEAFVAVVGGRPTDSGDMSWLDASSR